MAVTQEEADLGEFFDFQNAVSDGAIQEQAQGTDTALVDSSCVVPSNHCDESTQWAKVPEPQPEEPADDYTNFSKWIPRFVQPDGPCTYCRDMKLNCFLSYGKVTCTACDTLFRPCSFVKGNGDNRPSEVEDSTNVGLVDCLHPVDEDCIKEHGELTGVRSLRSQTETSKKASGRFSRAAVKILRDWLDEHPSNPYPSEEEKARLVGMTGLNIVQINTWLANARRRGKVGKNKTAIDCLPKPTAAIGIPTSANIEITTWGNMNPLERWKHSPPQNEPAPMTAIADALGRRDLPDYPDDTSSSSALGYRGIGSSRNSSNSMKRAQSVTSLEQSTSNSATSSAAWSGSHESFGSFNSLGSKGKRGGRRRRKLPTSTLLKKPSDDSKNRIYQCTFCTDTFKAKYDWTRHEKTLHLSLEKYVCCPLGPEIIDQTTGKRICAYCCESEPTRDHIETHNHRQCVEKGVDGRTFYRKDHLRQHLRLVHDSKLLPHMDHWRTSMAHVNSRCGFCGERFTTWADRNDHIAAHFKDGLKMTDWKGCRGLDPAVAALVNTAMPPYLIGQEAVSPNPFSATSPYRCMVSQAHSEIGGGPITCWEILSVRLGRFAKEQTDNGVILTDEMLQVQARHILYDSDDSWNQTAADNPEWLDLFKRAHALDYIPSELSGTGKNIPDDLEMYGDLGVRIPSSVQLERGTSLDTLPSSMLAQPKQKVQNGQVRTSGGQASQHGLPLPKNYPRFSSLPVPQDRAAVFETICDPWPRAGVVGQTVFTANSPSTGSSVSQFSLHPQTPAETFQNYGTAFPQYDTAQALGGDDYLKADVDALLAEANYQLAAQPKAGDLARQQNAMYATQHGMGELTPEQAQQQLAELNACMSKGTPQPAAFLDVGSDVLANSTDYNQSMMDDTQNMDFLSTTTGVEFDNAIALAAQGSFEDKPFTTTGHSSEALLTDTMMHDMDFNEINFQDMDFDIGFA